MTKRIFRSICLAALSVFSASLLLIMGMLYSYFSDVQRSQLRIQCALAVRGAEAMGSAYFDGLDLPGCRVTWISADGSVLYDSLADAKEMENHLQREEIREALSTGSGESERWSGTLFERALYSAVRLSDGSVLRLSVTQKSVVTLLLGMSQPILTVLILAVILSVILARRLSVRIVQPLNELDLDAQTDWECYEELSPLLHRIDSQQRQLKIEESKLRRKQDELDTVTYSMREGLVLLNRDGKILSINSAARALLGVDPLWSGDELLTQDRTAELRAVLAEAAEGRAAEKTLSLSGGGTYLADASPVFSGGELSGVVLLLFDVTEKEQSEQMRREFTANVSHELRTPLTTISGCAELLKCSLVKPEDVAGFGENIYNEARRMVRLVDDIISLSHLDEGAGDMKRELVDLYSIAEEAVRALAPKAGEAGVSLSLKGAPAPMEGVPQLLREIVGNLCDNAVKYNRPGGEATVQVEVAPGCVRLTVSDTGIGIPAEDQSRVFERFYRVDKSRSKAVGGTGLGLSIVKHAVKIHGGTVDLRSSLGKGTVITVCFPRPQREEHPSNGFRLTGAASEV